MTKLLLRLIALLPALIVFSCSDKIKSKQEHSENSFYTPGNKNRVAAEWEPALGTMITWPLCIPYKLVIELAKDNHLYTLVENENSKKEAMTWYSRWGIDSSKNTFIYGRQGDDAWWVRDWGPGAVFTRDGKMKLADGKYIYSTPYSGVHCDDSVKFYFMSKDGKIPKTETDDSATQYLGKALNFELLDLPFINTGGNVLTDGLGGAFSTCILLNENQIFGVSREKFFNLNKNLLGFDRYNVVSNFELQGVQHLDCYMKLLDEERILVIEPPKDHELYKIYEDIVHNELSKLKTAYGRPYEILRIKSDQFKNWGLAAYTNSLILNKTIYVPLFQIKEDSLALQRWREVMPGYTIKGFEFDLAYEPFVTKKLKDHYRFYGWDKSDGIHCRTRAVWDPEMLFISTRRIDREVSSTHQNEVYSTIIDYSRKGLIKEKCKLFWRVVGDTVWNSILLRQIEGTDHFVGVIPFNKPGRTVEYYLSALSNSGRAEMQPRTAPLGTYKFSIK